MNPTLLNTKEFFKKYRTPIISISIFTILIIICIPIISYFINKSYFPVENENLISEIPNENKDIFKRYLGDTLDYLGYDQNDIKDATIRENSVNIEEKLSPKDSAYHVANFLVDIDSVYQTYRVKIIWYNSPKEYIGETIEVSCPKISESKYPDSECITIINTSHAIDLWLPYEFTLDTGEKAVVKDTTIEQNGKTLQIYLYSCDDPNPPLKATEEVVKSWVEDTVKDPLADKYQYHVRYGYCENDRF